MTSSVVTGVDWGLVLGFGLGGGGMILPTREVVDIHVLESGATDRREAARAMAWYP